MLIEENEEDAKSLFYETFCKLKRIKSNDIEME